MNTPPGAGLFIALCGMDGAGKTTQLTRLTERFGGKHQIYATREPSDAYRRDPLVRAILDKQVPPDELLPALREAALYAAADRLRHLREIVYPQVRSGANVITDRYVYSSYAYFLARGLTDLDWLKSLNRHAPIPDLAIYLDVPPKVCCQRILVRDGQSHKKEEMDLARMTRVRQIFLDQPWGHDSRFHVVDGSQDADSVARAVGRLVKQAFKDGTMPVSDSSSEFGKRGTTPGPAVTADSYDEADKGWAAEDVMTMRAVSREAAIAIRGVPSVLGALAAQDQGPSDTDGTAG